MHARVKKILEDAVNKTPLSTSLSIALIVQYLNPIILFKKASE